MRLMLIILITATFNAVAATPPKESFDQMDAAFPDIEFINPQGEQTQLSDYQGKVVMVKLWGTWCGICQAKWPKHQLLYNSVKEESDVEIITISIFEDPQVSQDWADSQGYSVPLFKNLIQDRGAVQVADESLFFIKGTPMLFLIDKDGVLRKKAVGNGGSITESDIRALL